MHPIVIPLIIGAAGMFFGKASKPSRAASGFASIPYVLSSLDRRYLRQMGERFSETLSKCLEKPMSNIVGTSDGRACVGILAAHALVPMHKIKPAKWSAARDYVITNLQSWYPGLGLPPEP